MNPSPLRKDFCARLPPFMIDGTPKDWSGVLLAGTHLEDYPILWTKDNMANGMFNVHPYYTGERYFGKKNLLLRPPNTFMYTDNDLGSESPDIQNKFDIEAIQSTIDGLKKPFDRKGVFAARIFNLRLKRDESFSRLEWGIDAGLLERKDQGLLDDPTLAVVADPSTWVGGSLLVYLILDNSLTNGKYATEVDPTVFTMPAGLETVSCYDNFGPNTPGGDPQPDLATFRGDVTQNRTLTDNSSFRNFAPNQEQIDADTADVMAAIPNFGKVRWLVWYKQEAIQDIHMSWTTNEFAPVPNTVASHPWLIIGGGPLPPYSSIDFTNVREFTSKGHDVIIGNTGSYLQQRTAIVRDAVQQAAGIRVKYADEKFDLEAELRDFFELME